MVSFKWSLKAVSTSKLPAAPTQIGLFVKFPSEKSSVNWENPKTE